MKRNAADSGQTRRQRTETIAFKAIHDKKVKLMPYHKPKTLPVPEQIA